MSDPPDDERRRAGFGASSAFGGERAVSAGDVPLAFSAAFSAAGGLGGDRAAGLGDSAGVGAGGGGGIAGSAGLASGASAAGAPMAFRKLPSSNDEAFAAKAARTRCGSGGSDGGARTGDFFSPPLFRDVAAGSSKTTGVFGRCAYSRACLLKVEEKGSCVARTASRHGRGSLARRVHGVEATRHGNDAVDANMKFKTLSQHR